MTAQIYVNKIVKKVKCSRRKREEIRRQLLADIQVEMEQGVSLDVVMLRMGEPIAIAEEFNQNLSRQEYRKYKRGIAAKAIAGTAAVLAVLVLAAAWFLPANLRFGSSGCLRRQRWKRRAKK